LDLLIAAPALAPDANLISHNTREFRRVRGLEVEDWACRLAEELLLRGSRQDGVPLYRLVVLRHEPPAGAESLE